MMDSSTNDKTGNVRGIMEYLADVAEARHLEGADQQQAIREAAARFARDPQGIAIADHIMAELSEELCWEVQNELFFAADPETGEIADSSALSDQAQDHLRWCEDCREYQTELPAQMRLYAERMMEGTEEVDKLLEAHFKDRIATLVRFSHLTEFTPARSGPRASSSDRDDRSQLEPVKPRINTVDDPAGRWTLRYIAHPRDQGKFQLELELFQFQSNDPWPDDRWSVTATLGDRELAVARDELGIWTIASYLTEAEYLAVDFAVLAHDAE